MKLTLEIPADHEWLQAILRDAYDDVQAEVAKGDAPEYAAGRFAMVRDIASMIEGNFQAASERVRERLEQEGLVAERSGEN